MEYKKIIIFSISVLLVVVLLILGRIYTSSLRTQNAGNGMTATVEVELQQRVGEIVKTKNFALCDKVENEMYRTVCINNIALNLAQETNDITYCQKLDNTLISRADCERRVVLNNAVETEHIQTCEKAQDEIVQKECVEGYYRGVAIKKNDINVCTQAATPDDVSLCKNAFLINTIFAKSPNLFDCSTLYGVDTQTDCSKMKQILAKKSEKTATSTLPRRATPEIARECFGIKTQLFLPLCL